jgi:signal transduction histidine kinase
MSGRVIGLALIVLAAVLSATAAGIAGKGTPEAGVAAGGPGSRVWWVLPGGPAWTDGIRVGQAVVDLKSGVDPTGWALITSDGTATYTTSYRAQLVRLRDLLPITLLAVGLALASLILIRRIAAATGVAALSVLFASAGLAASGQEVLDTPATLLALLIPIAWLFAWLGSRVRLRLVLIAIALVVAGGWLIARYVMPAAYEPIDIARQAALASADAAVLIVLGDLRQWRRRLVGLDSRRAADLAAVIGVLAIAVFVWIVLAVPAAIVVITTAAAILLYPGFRHRLAEAIDQFVLGEVRDRASIKAVEEERSRIARDLHDAPLQEIAAVIRQLDGRPDTEQETELLRGVADHLRRVTTELRPPILDDLGLRAAIGYLADRAQDAAPHLHVSVHVLPDDPLSDRPPADVELAFFRILREAVDNAVRHAHAEDLQITATVLPNRVEAAVDDDGIGISPTASREAARAGHLGMLSMTQRASLIGADFLVERNEPHGTRLRVSWQAQR